MLMLTELNLLTSLISLSTISHPNEVRIKDLNGKSYSDQFSAKQIQLQRFKHS